MFARFKAQRIIYSATILFAYKTESFKAFSLNSFPKSDEKQLPKVCPLTWKSISDKKQIWGAHVWFRNSPQSLPQMGSEHETVRKH